MRFAFWAVALAATPSLARHRSLPCAPRDAVSAAALSAAPWLEDPGRAWSGVTLRGLQSLKQSEVFDLVEVDPRVESTGQDVVELIDRLGATGLFAKIEAGTGPSEATRDELVELELRVVENPRIEEIEGGDARLLEAMFVWPSRSEIEQARRSNGECRTMLPPRKWLLRIDREEIRPGIVWRGLEAALLRGQRRLGDEGRPLARIQADLRPDGILVLDVQDPALESVEIRGLKPHLRDEVLATLDVRPGQRVQTGNLSETFSRLEERWPFLERDRKWPGRRDDPRLETLQRPDGSVRYRFVDAARSVTFGDDEDEAPPRRGRKAWFKRFRQDQDRDRWSESWFDAQGRKLVLHLRTRRSDFSTDWAELIRHTPQTGFAPGLAGTETIYDPGDRVHLLLDGAFRVNTRRPSRDAPAGSFLEKLSAAERFDWLFGLRMRIPSLRVAELGAQLHNLTDTPDRWRMDRVDSYLYSALFNRPDSDYYRRSGATAMLTLQPTRRLTAGFEYRLDRYDELSPVKVWTLFNRDEALRAPFRVDAGTLSSALFRLEWTSEPARFYDVGGLWRYPEVSLLERESDAGLRVLATLEVGTPALGGDEQFRFLKWVGDARYVTGLDDEGLQLTLRARGAGGRKLPLQKQEALGGWSALRGYDFKEFTGDASALGSLELVHHRYSRHFPDLGAFLDVGSVRATSGDWMTPKASAGALLVLDDHAQVTAAWRLDSQARGMPEIRVLFGWPLWSFSR